MFQRIVVPVDFSPAANAAVAQGLALARQESAPLLLLHVVEEMDSWPGATSSITDLRHLQVAAVVSAEHRLHSLRQSVQAELADASGQSQATVQARVEQGPLPNVILDHLKPGSDLLVVSPLGQTARIDYRLGSVTERLVRECPCPLWLVRGKGVMPRKIAALATASSTLQAVRAGAALAQAATALAQGAAAPWHLLSTWTAPFNEETLQLAPDVLEPLRQAARDHARRFAALVSTTPEHVDLSGNAIGAALEWLEQNGTDLLVVGAERKGPISRIAEMMARYATCSVLVARG
jgi:nucleotide-binding universal stress UspA family protein